MKSRNISIPALLLSSLLVLSCQAFKDISGGKEIYYSDAQSSEHAAYNLDGTELSEAVVTVKKAEAQVYLQIDDRTTALALNIREVSFSGKRAIAGFRVIPDFKSGDFDLAVHVEYLNLVEEGEVVTYSEAQGRSYGADGIDIIDALGATSLEDGFLTVHYSVWFGGEQKHRFALVFGKYADPFEADLCHDSVGDPAAELSEGIVAFDLSRIPGGAEARSLKVHYLSNTGELLVKEFVRDLGTD